MLLRGALLFLLLLSLSRPARGEDFAWAGRGTISVDVPPGWKLHGQPADEAGYAFTARPELPVAAFLQMTVVRLPAGKTFPVDELADRLHESLRPYIEQSVEKEFRPVRLKCRQGRGWFAELTDANLVGKAPVPNDYKVMRSALLALDDSTLVIATMQFDNPEGPEAGEMLALVSSLQLPAAGQAALPSPSI